MGQFRIYVGGDTAISAAVQRALHANGGWWSKTRHKKHKVYDGHAEWICLDNDMEISYASQYDTSFGIELTLHDIFRDTSKWKRKAKEMTVSEISKELGYEVKIVK